MTLHPLTHSLSTRSTHRALRVAAPLAALLFVGCSDSATEPLPDTREPRVVFISNRDGNYEIYAMNADGTNQARLTTTPAAEGRPAWSPDGRQVAFTTERDGNREVYVMN